MTSLLMAQVLMMSLLVLVLVLVVASLRWPRAAPRPWWPSKLEGWVALVSRHEGVVG